jgi:CheY-like chemotaxis protein
MAERHDRPATFENPHRVLLVDNDQDIRDLVQAVLTDEGYEVTTLGETGHDAIAAAVGRVEPDCILLDGAEGTAFGDSWTAAAYLSMRSRSVPSVMFTAHSRAVTEARDLASDRAMAAHFTAVVPKPFLLDQLLEAVETATGRSRPFDRSEAGEQQRTAELLKELQEAGATDIRTSNRREWATFVSPVDQRIYQLYWWQRLGVYMVGRYDDAARLELIGRYFERREAIDAALHPAPA